MRITLQDKDTHGLRTVASGDEQEDTVSGVQVSCAQSVDLASPAWPSYATPAVLGVTGGKITVSWTVTHQLWAYLAGPRELDSGGRVNGTGEYVDVRRGVLVMSAPDGGGIILHDATLTASSARGVVAGTWATSCSVVASPVITFLGSDDLPEPQSPSTPISQLTADVLVLADDAGLILADDASCALITAEAA